MLPGPVFFVELRAAARRRRWYALRVAYGLALLGVIWVSVATYFGPGGAPGRVFSPQQLAELASGLFVAFLQLQAWAVGLLTPALVAGAIADEKQRKTIHALLTSPLSAGEVVLGKLAARLLVVAVFVAIGLPVMSLLTLAGGIDPALVLVSAVATLTAAAFVGALTILVSTVSARGRDAAIASYLLVIAWLTLPLLVAEIAGTSRWAVVRSIAWLNQAILVTHPIWPVGIAAGGSTPGHVYWGVAAMVGAQLAYASAFAGLAIWRLRPAAAGVGGRGRLRWPSAIDPATWRHRLRPAVFDDPMLWKELFVARLAGWPRVVAGLVGLVIFGLVAYATIAAGLSALREVATYGYGTLSASSDRRDFNMVARSIGAALYVLAALVVAAAAATSVTGEREGDTWTSLAGTLLEGGEVVRAKLLGALWAARGPVALIAVVQLAALVTGALHPIGLVTGFAYLAITLGFAAALGCFLSMKLRTSVQAMAATVGVLAILNVGYLLPVLLILPRTILGYAGCSPMFAFLSWLSYDDVLAMVGSRTGYWGSPWSGNQLPYLVLAAIASAMFYGIGGLVLAAMAASAYDGAAGRPSREPMAFPPRATA